jgi:hypothetical protein
LEWYDVYNYVEFISGCASRTWRLTNISIQDPKEHEESFRRRINFFLEREKSGYGFGGEIIVPITSSVEIQSVEQALSVDDKFAGARNHMQSAVALFGKKPEPDYRNAVKAL